MTTTDAPAPSPRAFRALLPVLRPEWRGMVGSYLVGTVSALALAALSVLTAWAVGHAVVERALPGPPWWFAVAGLVVLRTVLTWQEMDVSHSLAYRVLARMRMALFDSYARSVPGKRREHSGHAAGVAMDDIEKLEFFYAHTLAQLGASLTVLVTCLVTAFAVLPEAGAVLLAGSVLVAASALLGARATRRLGAPSNGGAPGCRCASSTRSVRCGRSWPTVSRHASSPTPSRPRPGSRPSRGAVSC
ncbi:hypothetical protein [Saccharomonospora sp. CUA-673]|uniref:hypothetical protein n=1 Tax=Saccharomonospora sp. CUA-673 TaxID=1904969 RepID=UPI000A64B656|nr:hypothetical protein [Saccharomonospora sp. CUA-673]